MSGWNEERRRHESEIQTLKNQITTSLEYLNSSQNINGFANQDAALLSSRESKINVVNEQLKTIKEKQSGLSQKLKQLLDEQMEFVQTSGNLRVQIKQQEEALAKSRELNKIRKEQAESLHTKYSGNLHSSWLGLWIPLSDEFRAGLLVTTVSLFCIIIAVLVFLWYSGYILPNGGQSMLGGFRFKKTRTLAHS